MFKNKILVFLAAILLMAISVMGYLFYDSYVKAFGHKLPFLTKQNPVEAEKAVNNENNSPLDTVNPEEMNSVQSKSNVPPGTEIPIGGSGQGSMPAASNPQGPDISLDGGSSGASSNKGGNQASGQAGVKLSDVSEWKVYTNKKYGYSFKYPKEYDYGPCDNSSPCKVGQVYEKDGGDSAWINGATNNQGWPYIIIIHYDNESYTLPKKTKFFDWLQQKLGWTKDNAPQDFNYSIPTGKGNPKKAMRVSIPQTPQAYARDEIYFENNGKIFQIQLLDSSKEPAKQFYDTWLNTLQLK